MITMHHHIESDTGRRNFFRYQSASSFDAQIKFLISNFYHSKQNLLNHQTKSFSITLDDGLKSHLRAADIMKQNAVTGTFYYLTSTPLGNSVLNVHLSHILLNFFSPDAKIALLEDLLDINNGFREKIETKYVYRHQANIILIWKLKVKLITICHQSS